MRHADDTKEKESSGRGARQKRRQSQGSEVEQTRTFRTGSSRGDSEMGKKQAHDGELDQVIYALANRFGRVFYVGRTINPGNRYYGHRAVFGPHISLQILQRGIRPDETASQAETRWINYFWNKTGPLANQHLIRRPTDIRRTRWMLVLEEQICDRAPRCFLSVKKLNPGDLPDHHFAILRRWSRFTPTTFTVIGIYRNRALANLERNQLLLLHPSKYSNSYTSKREDHK